jgi:hypothetical protein
MPLYQLKQSLTDADRGCVAAGLLHGQRPSLSAWYGTPLSRVIAARLYAAAQHELQTRLLAGAPCFQIHVLLLVCHFRCQTGTELEYEKLKVVVKGTYERALLELVYGQLLISCKKAGAYQHLADGFALAVDYLTSADYFQLVRQHELLAGLPLSDTPSLPQDLPSLLAEAAVIKQLQEGAGTQYRPTHLDTVG